MGWISFQLDGISHKYEKGMYDESYPDKSLLFREAYTYYLPADFDGSGNDPQYVFIALKSLVTDTQQARNGLTMSVYNDYDKEWKLGIAHFDENGSISQSDNIKLESYP